MAGFEVITEAARSLSASEFSPCFCGFAVAQNQSVYIGKIRNA
jgi:hypothetical protein